MTGLKPKSKEVLDYALKHPKASRSEAYKSAHKTANNVTAATNAYKLWNTPAAQVYLDKHITKATQKVVKLIDSRKDDIALRASQDVLDRTHGKAMQKTSSVSLNISLEEALNSLQ